jgi:hypothetical protein
VLVVVAVVVQIMLTHHLAAVAVVLVIKTISQLFQEQHTQL